MSVKKSLTQKYLPADCWKWYSIKSELNFINSKSISSFWIKRLSLKTSHGTTIYDCVVCALENPDSNVGLYAPGMR